MLNKITSLFSKVAERPTFKTDMMKVVDVAKNGTTATKVVLGTGAVLLSSLAVKSAVKSVFTVAGYVNKKSESRREDAEKCANDDLDLKQKQ